MGSATCEIEWFDEQGRLTGDDNPSIGRVRTKEYDFVRPNGSVVHLAASPYRHICAAHAKRLTEPGKEIWEWEQEQERGAG